MEVFESLPGLLEVIPVTHGYTLVSREVKPEDTVVEVHHQPDTALSDGPQSIVPAVFEELARELRQIAPVLGRGV